MTKQQILFAFVLASIFFVIGLLFRGKERRATNKEDASRYESDAAIMYLLSLGSVVIYMFYCILKKYIG